VVPFPPTLLANRAPLPGKFARLLMLLDFLKRNGRRVLLCVSDPCAAATDTLFRIHTVPFVRADSSQPSQCLEAITEFSTNTSILVFMLQISSSTSWPWACDIGPICDSVILLDSGWLPPALAERAISLCHRVGQKSRVSIFQLYSARTVEELLQRRASLCDPVSLLNSLPKVSR
jgi:hypothetical protein